MSLVESNSEIVLGLAEDFLERYRQGQRPSLKEYIDRHPELAGEIKEVFPAMAMMENIALADESLGGAPAAKETPPLRQLGDFRIIREVGHGGMGVVYEAEQVSLGRHVALKVLPQKLLVDAKTKRRFEREARAAAKLHHTNIVPVFGVGDHEGLPYYVMQFIQGLGVDLVLEELKHFQDGGGDMGQLASVPVSGRTGGSSPHPDVSAVNMARSLMTGAFQPAAEPSPGDDERNGDSSAAAPLQGEAASGSNHSAPTHLTSSGSITLPGQSGLGQRPPAKKQTYWQSVARIGVQVADALEYAHRQGVVHRDVKPSNLLLDMTGTVWVTDFGLAKAEGAENLTHTGDILGTLRYMPPEAFEGRADARGDVYALGLTLYELLALRPAFDERERNRLIKQVTSQEPARLRKLRPQVPRDLETIVHKAIDREVARRYPTAGELAADLQRYVDDEPIKARQLTVRERAWRWCRRNPAVAGLTAALVLLLVGVTLASVVTAAHFDSLAHNEARAAADERAARSDADEARQRQEKLRAQAETALQEVETQRQRAEANFAKARAAVDDYFTRVSESQLLQVPGLQPLRRELLQSALAFYQDFLKERGNDPTIRAGLATAHLRMGRILAELGQRADAGQAFRDASQLYEALTKANPDDVEAQHGLAECHHRLGRQEAAIALWTKLVQPEQPRFQKELAEAYNALALARGKAGKTAEALEAHQQALVIREMLVRLDPEDPVAHRDLGGTLNNIGVLLSKKGRREEALAMYRRALEHGEAAFARMPQYGRATAVFQNNVASAEHKFGHPTEALQGYQRVVVIFRRLARDNPAVPSFHAGLLTAYRRLADYQRELKQIAEADRTIRLARDMMDNFPMDGPENLFTLACVRAHGSTFFSQDKAQPTAEELADRNREADLALAALEKAVAAGFRDVDRIKKQTELKSLQGREDFRNLLAGLEATVKVEALAKDVKAAPEEKLKANEAALALRVKLAATAPKNRRVRADLAASRHAIGLIELDLGNAAEAVKSLEQAIALRQQLADEERANIPYRADLAASRLALGDLHGKLGRWKEAATAWSQGLTLLEASRPELLSHLVAAHTKVADTYAECGLWDFALLHYRKVFECQPPDNIVPWRRYALLLLINGDVEGYRRHAARLVERWGEGGSWDMHDLSVSCNLTPEGVIDAARVVAFADRVLKLSGANAWAQCELGIAEYRAGQFEPALRHLGETRAVSDLQTTRLVQAMIYHRQGDKARARELLEKIERRHEEQARSMLAVPNYRYPPSGEFAWWGAVRFELLRREARQLIEGVPPGDPPLELLYRGRLYAKMGEVDKAEAAFKAAVTARPNDPAVWLARGLLYAQLGQADRAEADIARAAAVKGNDPRPWIDHGRFLAENGKPREADAAFARAAALTPNELNRFLEAGWWAVGPYPDDPTLTAVGPPEQDPDPSKPVAAATGPGELKWQSVPTDPVGDVDFRSVLAAKHQACAYAMTFVSSPDERTATLLVGGRQGGVRVWLNGRPIHTLPNVWPDHNHDATLVRVPVTLRAGRNRLLLKVRGSTAFPVATLRLADNPIDRSLVYARMGLWDEAAAHFVRPLEGKITDPQLHRLYALFLVLSGNQDGYRNQCRRVIELYGQNANEHDAHTVAYVCSLCAEPVLEGAQLIERAERAAQVWNQRPDNRFLVGLAQYRAGRYDDAIRTLTGSVELTSWAKAWVVLALAHQRLGQTDEARQWLAKATEWYDAATREATGPIVAWPLPVFWWDKIQPRWTQQAQFQILYLEARRLIDSPDEKNANRDLLQARGRELLRSAAGDFDLAVLLHPDQPRLYLARAHRLVGLKREQEAEADFIKAVELKPTDPQTWKERGRVYAELGQTDKAAADFARALELLGDTQNPQNPWEADRAGVDDELARWDAVFDRVTQQRPNDWRLWTARCRRHTSRGEWQEASTDLARIRAIDPSLYESWLHDAALRLYLGDRQGYQQICRELLKRFDSTNSAWRPLHIAEACLLAPGAVEDLQPIVRLADQVLAKEAKNPWSQVGKFMVEYRQGRFTEALDRLSHMSLNPDGSMLDTEGFAFQAMAYHQLGRTVEARAALAKTRVLLERHLPRLDRGQSYDKEWPFWLRCWIVCREAETLIEGKKKDEQGK